MDSPWPVFLADISDMISLSVKWLAEAVNEEVKMIKSPHGLSHALGDRNMVEDAFNTECRDFGTRDPWQRILDLEKLVKDRVPLNSKMEHRVYLQYLLDELVKERREYSQYPWRK